MKAKPGDYIIPDKPENVFKRLQEYIGEMPEYVHTMKEYEVLDVKHKPGCEPLYIILGMPSLFESEMNKIFGKFKIK